MKSELQKELEKLRAGVETAEASSPKADIPVGSGKERMHFANDDEMLAAERRQGLIRAEELAKKLGISVRRVQQLRADGALVTKKTDFGIRYDAIKSLFALSKYLLERQDTASNRARAVRAEAEYKENKAELSRLEIRKRKGELHESHHVRELMNGWAVIIKATLQTLPGRIAVPLALCRTETECAATVREAINEALREICEHKYDPDRFRQLAESEGDFYADEEEAEEQPENNENTDNNGENT